MKQIWLNLPVKDVAIAKAFYKNIGFRENPMHENATHLASFFIGEHHLVMMLFPNDAFKKFANNDIADTSKGTEILLNLDAESRAAVDAMAKTVEAAGGLIYAQPNESQGWMYAMGFCDPDGHRWCMLHMDMGK